MDNFIEFLYSRFLLSDGVSYDLAFLTEGNLFFDFSGQNTDIALEKGAAFVVSSHPGEGSPQIIFHENPEDAMILLAEFHRSKIRRPILALTGSRGKTTLSALLQEILSKEIVTYRTPNGRHDLIGVAETILHVHPQVELTILEIGGEQLGQITKSCNLAKPTHGLITNIEKEHVETFGGMEAMIRGKSELFDYLRKTQGQVFINHNDHILKNMAKRFSNPVTYPDSELKMLSSDPYLKISWDAKPIATRFSDRFHFENIAAAIAVADHFEVSSETIETCLSIEP